MMILEENKFMQITFSVDSLASTDFFKLSIQLSRPIPKGLIVLESAVLEDEWRRRAANWVWPGGL